MIQIVILFLITLVFAVYLKCFSPLKLYCKKNKKNTKNHNSKGTYSQNTPSPQNAVSLTSYLEQRLRQESSYPYVAQNSPPVQHSQYYKNQPQQSFMNSPPPQSFNSPPIQKSQHFYNQPQQNYMFSPAPQSFNSQPVQQSQYYYNQPQHGYMYSPVPQSFNSQPVQQSQYYYNQPQHANHNKCIIDINALYSFYDPFYVKKHQQQGSGYSSTGAPLKYQQHFKTEGNYIFTGKQQSFTPSQKFYSKQSSVYHQINKSKSCHSMGTSRSFNIPKPQYNENNKVEVIQSYSPFDKYHYICPGQATIIELKSFE
ncbi:hypothetical protein DICPUDRAFT_83516 [Dictyostelium purpureum]|uniref:Uncharacterized protein n=1 Tax=Dictyostelium purpureum TaxID=5786 RepID=F0ZZR6_DICPU|nr:uncharacterized protein DICPUDRAFT_83516 [Dictyostelium purpureum]EGC30565.1 hypothetical protein DICPUDRAFT_83516 [Dictyostelium purpureum]|eukprot:XP_003292906.1 hypothetical protein DICPUDRAFT_83516 [Dictyostelium purpureum]